MGVYAKDLTRESVWEAMKARRCFATSVRGMVVEFLLNSHPMGSDMKDSGLRRIAGMVKGTAPLKYVSIIKNGDVWKEIDCGGKDIVEFLVEDNPAAGGTDFYYVRAGQSDEHMAWSSPIWVQV